MIGLHGGFSTKPAEGGQLIAKVIGFEQADQSIGGGGDASRFAGCGDLVTDVGAGRSAEALSPVSRCT